MAVIDNINGIPVSTIEELPVRKVILGDKTYSARYDEKHGIIYNIDALGQLTGEYKRVSKVNHAEEPKGNTQDSQKLSKKELRAQITNEKNADHHNCSNGKHSKGNRKKIKEKTEHVKKTRKKPDENKLENENSIKLFHPGAFILGMALVLAAAVGYFLYTTGGIL